MTSHYGDYDCVESCPNPDCKKCGIKKSTSSNTWILTTKGWEYYIDYEGYKIVLLVHYPNSMGLFSAYAIIDKFKLSFTEIHCDDVEETKKGIIKQYEAYDKILKYNSIKRLKYVIDSLETKYSFINGKMYYTVDGVYYQQE